MGLIEQLKQSGFSFKKGLGQNFIADEGYLKDLVDALALPKDITVVEVGTGAGTLTRVLAAAVRRVVTYEIDKRLGPVLSNRLQNVNNVELVYADALSVPDAQIEAQSGGGYTVVANIPYYITTPLLMKFIAAPACRRICMLVQDDVARRITADTGTRDYGALTVALQSAADCKIIRRVPRTVFIPQPDVDSAFVSIEKRAHKNEITDPNMFEKLLKGMFAARRKTAVNGLMLALGLPRSIALQALSAAKIESNTRPEQIPVQKFVALCASLK
jgi:16S rRNA (adenine1518-N6/adenine1519-N6)-dimethyltransferase